MSDIIDKLENRDIRPTSSRILILRVLEEADHPLSGQDIEDVLQTVDRSTITRSLALFVEKGVVHLIEDGSGSAKYEICNSRLDNHDDMHVHFHCTECGKTFCFTESVIPPVKIPEGFVSEKATYLLTGRCPECCQKEN